MIIIIIMIIMIMILQVVVPMPASVHGDPLYNSLSFGLAIHNWNGFAQSTADKVNGP